MFACQECGRKFKTTRAAERAVNHGCPGCGGTDIDVYVPAKAVEEAYDRYAGGWVGTKAEPRTDHLHPQGI